MGPAERVAKRAGVADQHRQDGAERSFDPADAAWFGKVSYIPPHVMNCFLACVWHVRP